MVVRDGGEGSRYTHTSARTLNKQTHASKINTYENMLFHAVTHTHASRMHASGNVLIGHGVLISLTKRSR